MVCIPDSYGSRIRQWIRFFTVCLFNYTIVNEHRIDPSFFLTNKTRAPQGEEMGLINPLSGTTPFSCSDKIFHFGRRSIDKFSAWAFGKSVDLFVRTFLKLYYWTLTLEVSQTSILITGVSSLIPSSSRIPTLPGHVANLLAILALYSTLPIVVTIPNFLWCLIKILDARLLLSLSDSNHSLGGGVMKVQRGSAGASVHPPPVPPHPSQHHHHHCHHQMTHCHNCLIRRQDVIPGSVVVPPGSVVVPPGSVVVPPGSVVVPPGSVVVPPGSVVVPPGSVVVPPGSVVVTTGSVVVTTGSVVVTTGSVVVIF
ncbi:hypothetical protein Tco_0523855 [Tanacetum coccineum]